MQTAPAATDRCTLTLAQAWGIALGLLAGWTAAGACGVLATSLQTLLVWFLLLSAALLVRPRWDGRAVLVVAASVAVLLLLPHNAQLTWAQLPLTVVAILGLLAWSQQTLTRTLLLAAASAVLCLQLLVVARMQVAAWWLASDTLGHALGQSAQLVTGRGLQLGASFAALDVLITAGIFLLLAARWQRPGRSAILTASAGLLAAQLVYLVLLSLTPELLDRLPPVQQPAQGGPYSPPPFCWSTVGHQLLPWNLPAVAALLQATTLVLIMRWIPWPATAPVVAATTNHSPRSSLLWLAAGSALVVLFALVAGLSGGTPSLANQRFVANLQDDIDYAVPQHDQYGQLSAGSFGLLPSFIHSLGGTFRTVEQFTAADAAETDVLLLLHASDGFAAPDVVLDYVRQGGALLVVTDGFTPEFGADSYLLELLEPTAIHIQPDAATSVTGNWQEGLQTCLHRATSTAAVPTNRLATDGSASLQLGWGAGPLVIGQWGWSAPVQGASWQDSQPLQTGAKIGDLVLAAQQRLGQGHIVVLGGNRALTNEGLPRSYSFVGNLLAYLAHGHSGPQATWRQVLGTLLALAAVLALAWRRPTPLALVAMALALSSSFAAARAWSSNTSQVLPRSVAERDAEGETTVRRIAYIDHSHLESFDWDDWGFDSINGLALNLMRNGYLPLALPHIDRTRLADASLLVCLAPARTFSSSEQAAIVEFVASGGTLICTAGAEEAAASNTLLSQFQLHVPATPQSALSEAWEPEPLGRTQPLYLVDTAGGNQQQSSLRMFAAWPVQSLDGEALVLATASNQLRVVDSDTEYPVVLARPWGDGAVILIGDSSFALNKNLEYIGGEPFAGQYENAHFWRWLLSAVTDQEPFVPPPYKPAATAVQQEEEP